MSILGNIMSSIFGGPTATASASASPQSSSGAQAASPAQSQQVDVAAVMDKLAEQSDEELDWRKSIVDMLKLLGQDSSLTARKQLAEELRYTGDTKDSGAMNVWLHKQVMTKLAQNGGKLPPELKH